MKKIDWKLCLIADVDAAAGRNVPSLVKQAVEAGVTLVQLRAKKLETRQFLSLALEISAILKTKNIPFIVNDRVDIALSCGANGVHLGQNDLPLPFARKILGIDKLIGITVNTVEEAIEAEAGGADYLGAGPVFFTPTKKELRPLLGLEGLKAIREKVKMPVLAIGSISPENAGEAMACGVNGIAVISAILGATDIRKATQEIIAAIKRL